MARITDYIKRRFSRKNEETLPYNYQNVMANFRISKLNFGRVVFLNIIEILTDLFNDVELISTGKNDALLLAQFKVFLDRSGQFLLNQTYVNGFVVVAQDALGFRILNSNEYTTNVDEFGYKTIVANNPTLKIYVVYSETYLTTGESDGVLLAPFITYLDNVLNGSNTLTERMGALVVASPRNGSTAPTAAMLTKDQKDDLEKEMMRQYGCLDSQRNIMVLPREMDFSVINLAGIDQRTNEKARLAILAICDRIKVPGNQVAIIDANSSKSLSNGSELREGDFNKYQSFERLFSRTILKLAHEIGLQVDYTIYNKPQRQTPNQAQ